MLALESGIQSTVSHPRFSRGALAKIGFVANETGRVCLACKSLGIDDELLETTMGKVAFPA